MRLDKYLKYTRLIKRRGVAKVLISEGSILVNEKIVKPSYDVAINDFICLKLGFRLIKIKVIKLLENPSKNESQEMYEIISENILKN